MLNRPFISLGPLLRRCSLGLALVTVIGTAALAFEWGIVGPPPDGWQVAAAPETANGPALFDMINGGAVRYMQYGFKSAFFATYRSPDARLVNLEIYRMNDAEAARGVFREKTGDGERPIRCGDEARLADTYLNFRRGVYQVTVSGYDTEPPTVDAITALAGWVDVRLVSAQGR